MPYCYTTILFMDYVHDNITGISDSIYQKMYRCLTENKGKKNGFVIDVSYKR